MKLLFENGNLYVNNVKFCFYEVRDGKTMQPGTYAVESRYAHCFGKVLPHVHDIGWIGADAGSQIILGRVRTKSGLIPEAHLVSVLIDYIDVAQDTGAKVLAEVK